MRNRLDFVSDDRFTVPTAAPVESPYDPATGVLRPNYWKYNHNNANLHITVQADAGWNVAMVASIVTLWGYAENEEGEVLPPSKIFQYSVSEPLPVDVEVTANCLGYGFLYLQNDSGTAVKASIIRESKRSSSGNGASY